MADQRGIKRTADGDNPEKKNMLILLLSRSGVDPYRHNHHQDVHSDTVISNQCTQY